MWTKRNWGASFRRLLRSLYRKAKAKQEGKYINACLSSTQRGKYFILTSVILCRFAFVEFRTVADAEEALQSTQNMKLLEREVKAQFYDTQEKAEKAEKAKVKVEEVKEKAEKVKVKAEEVKGMLDWAHRYSRVSEVSLSHDESWQSWHHRCLFSPL